MSEQKIKRMSLILKAELEYRPPGLSYTNCFQQDVDVEPDLPTWSNGEISSNPHNLLASQMLTGEVNSNLP